MRKLTRITATGLALLLAAGPATAQLVDAGGPGGKPELDVPGQGGSFPGNTPDAMPSGSGPIEDDFFEQLGEWPGDIKGESRVMPGDNVKAPDDAPDW